MELNYYNLTVPLFKKNLENLKHILTKAEALMVQKSLSESEVLEGRIAPDMLPFSKQIQIATDNAKGVGARLAGIDAPVFDDTEKTIAELRARIEKTIAFLNTLTEAQFSGAGEREIRLKYFAEKHFTGYGYVSEYAISNFLFHVTTAYCILRMMGAEIGKADFMGNLPLLND